MSTEISDNDRSNRRLSLPSPGVSAVITVSLIVGGITLSIWWPYHCEQRVLEQVNALPGIRGEATYEFVGPRVLERYVDREWMTWFRRVERLKVTESPSSRRSALFASFTVPKPVVDGMPSLELLGRCNALEFSRVAVTDVRSLNGAVLCEELQSVHFDSCDLERESLRGLDGHSGIVEVVMTHCFFTGNILELPELQSLRAFRGNAAHFRQLDVSRVPNLRRVEAKNCSFSDEGVRMLLDAPRIEVLMVPYGALTDTAVHDLLELQSLRYLDLRGNHHVTRAGLERLADLSRLKTVNLWGTIMEDRKELKGLQEVLPQARSDRRQL